MRSTLLACLLLAACTGPVPERVDGREPVTPRDLYRLRTATEVALSPDGRTAVYVQQGIDSARNRYEHDLWAVPADGSGRARRLTRVAAPAMGSPVFSPEGSRIAFLAPARNGTRQIWVMELEGRPWQLTRLPSGAADPAWSPAGDRIAFTSTPPHSRPREDPRVVTRPGSPGEPPGEPERWRQVYVVDARPRARPLRVTSTPWHHGPATWSPDGRALLFPSAMPRGDYHPDLERESDLLLVPLGGGPARRLVEPGHTEGPARFSPDGRHVAYLRQRVDTPLYTALDNELVLMRADGTQRRSVSGPLDRPVADFSFAPDGSLLFTVRSEGAVSLYRTRTDRVAPVRVVGGPRGVLAFASGRGRIAWAQTDARRPGDVHAARLDGTGERRLTALNDSLLARRHVAGYEEIRYRSFDGTPIQGWFLRPPAATAGVPPLAVEIHGGPHLMWGPGEPSTWLELQSLAGAGYTVFFCNPRGSAGYGAAGLQSIRRNWAGPPARDVLVGADSVLARGLADPARQVVTGGSYGGYLTAWLIAREAPGRFRAAAAQRAPYDLALWWGGSDAGWFFEAEFGGPPWMLPELTREQSPLTYVDSVRTPLLMLHGEADVRTPIAGAEAFYRSLRRRGREAALVRYPREGHELTRSGEPAHRVDHMRRIIEWFDRHGGSPAP